MQLLKVPLLALTIIAILAAGCTGLPRAASSDLQPALAERTVVPASAEQDGLPVFDQNHLQPAGEQQAPQENHPLPPRVSEENLEPVHAMHNPDSAQLPSSREPGPPGEPVMHEQPSEPVPFSWILPFKISETYNRRTRSQGDLSFAGSWVIVPFAGNLNIKSFDDYWDRGNNPDIWFEVQPGTLLRASTAGRVRVGLNPLNAAPGAPTGRDWELSIQIGDGPYWVEYDHVVDVQVKDGDFVEKGQPLARAAPAALRHGGSEGKKPVDEFEWGLRLGGNPPKGVCPVPFLEKAEQEKLKSALKTMQSRGFAAKETVCLTQEVA